MVKTKSASLQAQLEAWAGVLSILSTTPLADRQGPLLSFVRTFVPPDVEEEDITHFTSNLYNDEEFFASFVRDISQCASGDGVEKIEGNQNKRAEFIILPPEGTLQENSSLDIVRQVAFICSETGTWTAEG